MRTWIISTALCLITWACSENGFDDVNSFNDDTSIQTVNGTWKLTSFEDFATEKVEFQNETNSWGRDIIITFNDSINPRSISGENTTNTITGEFEYTSNRQIHVQNLFTTKVGQPDWGNKFSAAILSGDLDFIINKDRLRIFYNSKMNSMTFNKQ